MNIRTQNKITLLLLNQVHRRSYSIVRPPSPSSPPPISPSPSPLVIPPKFPVILCHGLLGFDRLGPFDYFWGIKRVLETAGITAEVTAVAPTTSIATRAEQLRDQLLPIVKKYNTKVHIIAHSMGMPSGGLDSRYLVSKLVRSITTLASPHRGSSIATWGISRIGVRLKLIDMLQRLKIPYDAFLQLTPEYLNEVFNPATLDHPEVSYFSYGASKQVGLLNPLYFFNQMLWKTEGENDGLVSVESSKWGEYLGTTSCDHMELINWSPIFDASSIYLGITSSLSKYETAIEQKSGN